MNIDLIKRAAVEAIDASNPCKILYGTVTKANPIEVKVSDTLILTKPFLVIDSKVDVGEKVVLVRYQGGQKYLILSTEYNLLVHTYGCFLRGNLAVKEISVRPAFFGKLISPSLIRVTVSFLFECWFPTLPV